MIAEELRTARGGLDLRPGVAARCTRNGGCGWEGVPTYIRGRASTLCPSCEGADVGLRIGPGYDDLSEEIDAEAKRRSLPKVGRNEPCPCGSGKKSKRCCYT